VPAGGDLKTSMRWYIESSHYSRELGSLILDRVLNRPPARAERTIEIGVLIDTANIELLLSRTWRDAEAYRIAFPADAAEIGEIVQFIRRSARR
jgi:hypothetical protein